MCEENSVSQDVDCDRFDDDHDHGYGAVVEEQ